MLKRAIPTPQWAAITLLAALIFCLLLLRTCRSATTSKPPSPPPVIVEVRGDIPHPGIHLLPGPTSTVFIALEAAGWNATGSNRLIPEGIAQETIESGNRLRVFGKTGAGIEVAVEKMDGATGFALGLRLDLNSASEDELLLVPLMRPEWARTIVERRKQKPWKLLDELDEIHGIGPKTLEKWRPHLEAIPPSP